MAYGFEFKDVDGKVILDNTRTGVRLIHTFEKDGLFNGVVSVPNFDINKGAYFVKLFISAYDWASTARYVVDYSDANAFPFDDTQEGYWFGSYDPMTPQLSWDNTNREMSITPAPDLSPDHNFPDRPSYQVKFFHYI